VLELYGPPVYVLNDIVHNAAVVNMLRARGVVFVRAIEEVPRGAHLLFSAHGVGPDAWAAARARDLDVVDATCPLVEKVHREAVRFAGLGYTVVLIGERGHDEVTGTAGWGRVRDPMQNADRRLDGRKPPRECRMAKRSLGFSDPFFILHSSFCIHDQES
jgi:(E)-4-hydroxy-3-methyl-but-2-enyl pyrophosphate reductase